MPPGHPWTWASGQKTLISLQIPLIRKEFLSNDLYILTGFDCTGTPLTGPAR